MSAARVALDVLLSADDPSAAFAEMILEIVKHHPVIADHMHVTTLIAGPLTHGLREVARFDAIRGNMLYNVYAVNKEQTRWSCYATELLTGAPSGETWNQPETGQPWDTKEEAIAYADEMAREDGWHLLNG